MQSITNPQLDKRGLPQVDCKHKKYSITMINPRKHRPKWGIEDHVANLNHFGLNHSCLILIDYYS